MGLLQGLGEIGTERTCLTTSSLSVSLIQGLESGQAFAVFSLRSMSPFTWASALGRASYS